MKKYVLVAVVAVLGIIALPANAQVRFGIKGGANISKVSINKEVLNSDNVTGFNVGPMMEFTVPIVGVGMDAAILYSQRGVGTWNDESMKTSYLDVPVNLKWKVGIPLAKFYAAAGPYISFRIGGDKKSGWMNIPGSMIARQLKAQSFGAGLNFGAGVELLSHLQIGFNYGLGLTNDFRSLRQDPHNDEFEADGKSRGWSITAAILF